MGKVLLKPFGLMVWLVLFSTAVGSGNGHAQQGGAQQLFFDAFELRKAGKLDAAAAKFEQGLKVEPDNAPANYYLGETYLALGKKDQARARFDASLKADPNSPVAPQAKRRLAELSGKGTASAAPRYPKPGTEFQDCDVCPAMVVIPAGSFVMGSPPSEAGRDNNEGPAHEVTLAKPFALGKYEVTFNEWDACARAGDCGQVGDEGWGRGRQPVINVTWEEAVGFTEWLSEKTGKGYRLPSEAEWEYAARAGSQKPRFWGTSTDRACQFANVYDWSGETKYSSRYPWPAFACDDGYPDTAPVGSFRPNAFGLYDMLGNVWEWTEDCYDESYAGAPADGSASHRGDCGRRVNRGGSWDSSPLFVRSASRGWYPVSARNGAPGFRVARTLP